MSLHHGEMNAITRGEAPISQNNLLRLIHHCSVNGHYLVYSSKQCVESRLNCITTIDGRVAVEDFLEYLGVRDKPLTVGD